MPPSRFDRWQANFLEKSSRSPIPITVYRGTCNEREARSSPRKRQGCCRKCSRFFVIHAVFKEYRFRYACLVHVFFLRDIFFEM